MKNRIELRDAAAPELIIGGPTHRFDKPADNAKYRAGGYPSGLNEAAVPRLPEANAISVNGSAPDEKLDTVAVIGHMEAL